MTSAPERLSLTLPAGTIARIREAAEREPVPPTASEWVRRAISAALIREAARKDTAKEAVPR